MANSTTGPVLLVNCSVAFLIESALFKFWAEALSANKKLIPVKMVDFIHSRLNTERKIRMFFEIKNDQIKCPFTGLDFRFTEKKCRIKEIKVDINSS
jgi:hypothetical protein